MTAHHPTVAVGLVSDVFYGQDGTRRLHARLREARDRGATVVVLPELPLDRWSPASRTVRDDDAEPPGGPRHGVLADASRAVGVGIVGGAIVRHPSTGVRHNTALVFDASGRLVVAYRKLHLPDEPGFWESDHYVPGDRPPERFDAFGMPMGVQICSDVNRPEGSCLLAADGAEAVLVPRATEASTWDRWSLVLRATALTCAAFVLTVNRREPDLEVPLGGPSAAFDPQGAVLVESEEPVVVVTLDGKAVRRARLGYPGYLPFRAQVYAEGWTRTGRARSRSPLA